MDPKSHTQGCQPHGDQILCIDPPMCFKPAQWVCAENGPVSCVCEVPPPVYLPLAPIAAQCTATITYPPSAPGVPAIVMPSGCDVAGAELAIAVILSQLLGAARPCTLDAVTCGFLGAP